MLHDKQMLNAIFLNAELKARFFRLFGYQGNLEFTIYPDCWIRDLTLLDIGRNVYLGDGICLGTNRISPDQSKITVGPITIGADSIFDQRCALGPGTRVGRGCQFGFDAVVSTRCKIGDEVQLSDRVSVSHCVKIGDGVTISTGAIVGQFAQIEAGCTIADFAMIPAFSKVFRDGRVVVRER